MERFRNVHKIGLGQQIVKVKRFSSWAVELKVDLLMMIRVDFFCE